MHPRQIDGASRPAVSGRILVPAPTMAWRRFPGMLIPSCKRPAPTMQVLHHALCSRISGLNMNPDTDMMPLFARFSLISVLLLSLGGCNTTSVIRDFHLETDPPAKPDKIAVVVMIPDELQRLSTERVLVEDINSSGGNARASSQIRGMRGRLTRDKAEQALREWGADSVVVVFLRGGMKGEALERSDYYLVNVGTGVSYNWFAPQFVDVYTVVEGPGFYDQERTLYVESTYYDLRSEEARWTIVTESKALEYRDTAKSISGKIVRKMKRDGSL